MKRFITLSLAMASFILSAQENSPQPLKFSLEEAIGYAVGNNINQKVLQISKQSADETVAQSKRDLLPNLSASLSQSVLNSHDDVAGGTTGSGNYSLNTSVTVYNGSQNWNSIRLNKMKSSLADTKVAQAQNQLMLNVIQSFLSILMNDELLRYQREVERVSGEQVVQGLSKFRAGQILESDYLLLESQYATDKYNVINTEITRNNSLLQLKNFLSIDANTPLEIIPPDTSRSFTTLDLPGLDVVIEETMAWLPDIQISERNIELARMQTSISKGAYLPTVSINGSVGSGYSGGATSWGNQFGNRLNEQIALTISIPLWDRGKTQSSVKQNRYAESQATLEAEQTRLNVRKQLEQEYQNVISTHNKYTASTTKHKAQQEVFRVYGSKFEAGSITAVDLLQQQTNYLSALNDFIQSKYSYILNRKVVDVYMGKEITL